MGTVCLAVPLGILLSMLVVGPLGLKLSLESAVRLTVTVSIEGYHASAAVLVDISLSNRSVYAITEIAIQ
jgi:hypothetical protein